MEELELILVDEICKQQDFDEILLQIARPKKNNTIKRIIKLIDENVEIDEKVKRKIYDGIFEYVNDINENIKVNIKEIYSYAVKETIKKFNNKEGEE